MTMNNAVWTPSFSDIQWTRNLLRILCHGGQWAAPIMSTFIIDKQEKKLTLVQRSPKYSHETYLRVVRVCGMLGYTVSERKQS